MTINVLIIDDDEAINYFYARTLKETKRVENVLIFEHAQAYGR